MPTLSPAKFWFRFASFFLDLFLFIFLTGLIVLGIINFDLLSIDLFSCNFWMLSGIVFGILILISSIIQGLTGYDLAKAFLGLKLLDANEDRPIGVIRSLFRNLLSIFSILLFTLGYLAIAFNIESKSLHDLISSARVVKLPVNGFQNFIRMIFFLVSLLAGLALSLSLIAALSLTPYVIGRSLYNLNKYSSQESAVFTTDLNSSITIPVASNKKVFGLTEFKKIDYVEYSLNKLSKYSYITEATLRSLGGSYIDNDLIVDTENKPLRAVIIPRLVLKDSNSQDLIIHDQRFIVNKTHNELGNDVLALWDSKYDQQNGKLILSLYDGDKKILENPELSQEVKDYLIHILRTIRTDWDEYLKSTSVEALTEFSEAPILPVNDISFEFDATSGYIKHLILNKPSESVVFNNLCEDFFKKLERFRLVPDELKASPPVVLNISLQYKEMV
jgi:uncharacterized RDD family membrane protein YckC